MLTAIRGVGVIAYSGAVIMALPEENISRDLLGLLLLEFFHGMLYPTIRTKVLSGRIPICEHFCLMALAAIVGGIVLAIMVGNVFAVVCIGLYFLAFPFYVSYSIQIEKKNIEKSTKVEAYVALVSSLSAGAFIITGSAFEIGSEFLTPILRVVAVPFVFFIALSMQTVMFSPMIFVFPSSKTIVESMPGLDYLGLLVYFRYKILLLASGQHDSAAVIKFITVSYEPLSSIYGYFLRFVHSKANFNSRRYVESTKLLLFGTFCLMITLWLSIQLFGEAESLTAMMTILFLLGAAAFTTHHVIGTMWMRILLTVNWIGLIYLVSRLESADMVLVLASVSFLCILVRFKVFRPAG